MTMSKGKTHFLIYLTVLLTIVFSAGVFPKIADAEQNVSGPSLTEFNLPNPSPEPPNWQPLKKNSTSVTSVSDDIQAPSIWVTNLSESSLTLVWTSGYQVYELQRWAETSQRWEVLYRGEQSSFTYTNLPRDTYSFFRVAGWYEGWSPWSFQGGYLATYNESAYNGQQPKLEVDSLSEGIKLLAEGGDNYAVLKWDNNDWTPVYANDEPVFTDKEAGVNKTNYYAAFAKQAGDWEAFNGNGFIHVNSPPSRPKNVKVVPQPFLIQLSWNPVDEGEDIAYWISVDGKRIAETRDTTYTITGLRDSTTYLVSIRAINKQTSAQSTAYKKDVETLPFSMTTYTYKYENNRLKAILANGVVIVEYFYDQDDGQGRNVRSIKIKQ